MDIEPVITVVLVLGVNTSLPLGGGGGVLLFWRSLLAAATVVLVLEGNLYALEGRWRRAPLLRSLLAGSNKNIKPDRFELRKILCLRATEVARS